MKIKDITFKKYYELEDKSIYDYALRYSKIDPEDVLNIGSLKNYSFGFVKDMQYYVSSGITWEDFIEAMTKITDYTAKDLSKLSIFKLKKSILYIIEEVKKINKMESDYLGHDVSIEEEQADIGRFNEYGPFIQFDKLAGGDVLKYDQIKELNYELCFTKLKLENDMSQYMEDIQRIRANKNK
jgi:hypothetical protein